ncbi:CBS domain-containing protein [Solilutibacter pythonis]|nr:CBS domain-containing protein [Lysobacter pythonis]
MNPNTATLRDLLRPAASLIAVAPGDSLRRAFSLMREHGVSQLPVLDQGRILGIIDESDLLLQVYGERERFDDKVETVMVRKLDSLAIDAPLDALLPLFERGHIALVDDDGEFAGLITRSDLLAWLAGE